MAFCESRIKCKTNTSATIYFTKESANFYKKINILGILALLKHEDYLCYWKGIIKNYKSKQTNAD